MPELIHPVPAILGNKTGAAPSGSLASFGLGSNPPPSHQTSTHSLGESFGAMCDELFIQSGPQHIY